MSEKLNELFDSGPEVINIGIRDFAAMFIEQEVEIIHVDWAPPAGGDEEMIELLDELL